MVLHPRGSVGIGMTRMGRYDDEMLKGIEEANIVYKERRTVDISQSLTITTEPYFYTTTDYTLAEGRNLSLRGC